MKRIIYSLKKLGMSVICGRRRKIGQGMHSTPVKIVPNGVKDTGSYALNALVFGDIHGGRG